MKHKVFHLLLVLIITIFCINLTSCNDDGDKIGNSALVGTWYQTEYSGRIIYYAVKMLSNGDFYYTETEGTPYDDDYSKTGTWSATASVILIQENEENDGELHKIHYSLSEDGTTLYITEEDDDDADQLWTGTWKKAK